MTLRCASPEVLTVTGCPSRSSTTREQVASKPMPPTLSGAMAASAIAARTDFTQASQMSWDDCSTISPASCQILIGCRAVASSVPASSNTPARVLVVPTSTPIYARGMVTPGRFPPVLATSLPASVAAIHQHDAACHQARRFRGEEQHDRGDLLDLPHPRHRGSTDPGVVHLRIALHESVERRLDIG